VLLFAVSTSELQKQLQGRVGQCVLTSPGSACYAGLDGEERLKLGNAIRYFGDGWQISKRFGGRHYWRIPVMDGEFLCEATTGLSKGGVGGGNLLIMGKSASATLQATEAAVKAIRAVPDVIMPFPGGIARSGSKVGSKYKTLRASTNDAFCPTLRGAATTALDPDVVLRSDGGTALPEASVVLHGPAAVAEYGLRIHQPSAVVRPALVNGAAGLVVTLGGRPVAVVGVTVSRGTITEIDVLADPERLRRLDLASLA